MPFIGLGLHILIAVFFAIHVVRSGQQLYWLIILFSFPLLGSLVYFLAIYLPGSRIERGAQRAATRIGTALDPTRELREARADFDHSDTAQNRMRYAAALFNLGHVKDAADQYRCCLEGPFANDAEIQLRAAQAYEANGDYDEAVQLAQTIRTNEPNFRPIEVAIVLAKSLNGAGRSGAARDEFEAANAAHDSFDIKAEYAICALGHNDLETVRQLKRDIDVKTSRWSRSTRELNAPMLKRLAQAFDEAKQ